jgi:hypothetical protein
LRPPFAATCGERARHYCRIRHAEERVR